MYSIFMKKLAKQGIAFVLICALIFSPVFGPDKSYGQDEVQSAMTSAASSASEEPIAEPAVEVPVIKRVKNVSCDTLEISWNKVPGANGYVLYKSASENGKYKKIAVLKGNGKTSFINKKVVTGRTYFYKVKAFKNKNGKKLYSTESALKFGRTTPSKTSINKNTVYGYKSVTLKWNKSKGAKGYRIYRSTKKSKNYKLVKTVSGRSNVQWTNKNLKARKTYYYKVVPYTKVDNTIVEGRASAVYKKKTVSRRVKKLTQRYKKVDYVYGGNSPRGWDCSGFTQWSAKYVSGKSIPRTALAQASKGKKISKSNKSKWRPGDIFIYADPSGRVCHSAVYVGDNKIMHALNERVGTVVQNVDFYEKWDSRTKLKYVKRY